jgi:transcriptional regulator with XRE-family HTH domain
MSDFSEWLIREMERQELSLRDVAKATGVGHTSVRGWQAGTAVPSFGNCKKLAEALGTSVDFVRTLAGYVDGEPEQPPAEPPPTWLVEGYIELDEFGRKALETTLDALLQSQRRASQ